MEGSKCKNQRTKKRKKTLLQSTMFFPFCATILFLHDLVFFLIWEVFSFSIGFFFQFIGEKILSHHTKIFIVHIKQH
jgi:hypothetical protein